MIALHDGGCCRIRLGALEPREPVTPAILGQSFVDMRRVREFRVQIPDQFPPIGADRADGIHIHATIPAMRREDDIAVDGFLPT